MLSITNGNIIWHTKKVCGVPFVVEYGDIC